MGELMQDEDDPFEGNLPIIVTLLLGFAFVAVVVWLVGKLNKWW